MYQYKVYEKTLNKEEYIPVVFGNIIYTCIIIYNYTLLMRHQTQKMYIDVHIWKLVCIDNASPRTEKSFNDTFQRKV